jgi:pseudaminic acid cytidylyltransferase
MNTIAIIPARSGSKRIPKKNIKKFFGKPMISYAIEAAGQSGIFDKIIVSTDSDEVSEIALQYGAEVPFMRPPELSDDHTPTAPVLLHTLDFLLKKGIDTDYICCIYPTAVFIQSGYLIEGHRIITENNVSSVFSVTSYSFPIFRALKINSKQCLEMFWPEHEMTRSQDLPEAYHDAGQFYWLDADKFRKSRKIYGHDSMPVILPRYLVQDIDTPEDWEVAERLYRSFDLKN